MNPIKKILALPLAIFLSSGILFARFSPNLLQYSLYILGFIFLYVLLDSSLKFRSRFLPDSTYPLYLASFLIGYLLYATQLPQHNKSHFSHFLKQENLIQLEINEVLKTTSYYQQYIAEVQAIDSNKTKGKVLLRIALKDSIQSLKHKELVAVKSNIQHIPAPFNPYEVDFRAYYRSLNIFHRMQVSKSQILLQVEQKEPLNVRLRNKALAALNTPLLSTESEKLIQAMVLGYRNEWTSEQSAQYSKAGVAHVLAISGLHVGILYLGLTWVFSPLKRSSYLKRAIPVLILIVLWTYAWFTGMSASVTRTVSMLSLYLIAQAIKRPAPALHTIGMSYILLLIIKPYWLFSIGFQLSYAAVFFIVWLSPKLQEWYTPKNKYADKIWQLISVTLIAQIGVLPLTMYYFGSFPVSFILSNIIILSLVSLLLFGGIIALILLLLNIPISYYFDAYNKLIWLVDKYTAWISNKSYMSIEFKPISIYTAFWLYILLVLGLSLAWDRSFRKTRQFLMLIISLLSIQFIDTNFNQASKVWLLHQIGKTSLLHEYKNEVIVYSNDSIKEGDYLYKQLHSRYKKIETEAYPSLFKIKETKFLTIDKSGLYPTDYAQDAHLIIQQNPSLNIEKLIDEIKPKIIIVDGSNYHSNVKKWKEIAIKKQTPFIYTGEKGAYLIYKEKSLLRKYLEKIFGIPAIQQQK